MTSAVQTRCALCPVQSTSLCGALNEETSCALSRIAHRIRVPAGRVIYGGAVQQPRSFGIIVSGVIKLVITKPDGRQQIVGLQFPSDFVGRPLVGNSNLSAEAATKLDLCCFSGRAFEALMREHPQLEHALLRRMVEDLDAAREWAFLLGRTTAQEKVASLLYVIAKQMGKTNRNLATKSDQGFHLPLTRMEMAECLSLRLETVCRQFKQLKDQGVIAASGRRNFDVLDVDELKRRAEYPKGASECMQ
jgi:CRP/FNR family transcriptional regulator